MDNVVNFTVGLYAAVVTVVVAAPAVVEGAMAAAETAMLKATVACVNSAICATVFGLGGAAGAEAAAAGQAETGAAETLGQLEVIGDLADYSASEVRAAEHMVNLGKNVILRPPTGAERVSDLLVDNVPYDVYTPTTTNADRIISAIAKKNAQAQGIVLDLSQTTVRIQELGDILARVRGAGATNITDIVVIGGN
jgi:filamentous hemagglutinin